MVKEYGDRLQILAIDVTQPAGQQLYLAAVERYQIQQQGVPTLVVGERVLIGARDIPEQFPALVEAGLAAEGIAWPDIPGLTKLLPEAVPSTMSPSIPASPAPTTSAATLALEAGPLSSPEPDITLPPPDPLGFALAGIVLAGLFVSLGYAVWRITPVWPHLFRRGRPKVRTWAIPALALLGLGVALYLAYVEITHIEAVCGPIGECNLVQASPYAQLFGVPIAVWGGLFYIIVGVLWIGQFYLAKSQTGLASLGLLVLATMSVLFSIYLTWLEIFVIQAVCAWCLSSAVITAALLVVVLRPVTYLPLEQRGGR
jgi:uncharacterized membrane protein